MKKYKISIVSYLNTLPFTYGIKQSEYILQNSDISFDIPSVCADKLISGNYDIGLIPVATIPNVKNAKIITDFCIGSFKEVQSVLLVSEVPLQEIKTIYLDYQSRTSVNLAKVLAKNYWNISPKWENTTIDYEKQISGNTAGVIIGDRTFGIDLKQYKYSLDLSLEWFRLTGLSFVFACWVANKDIDSDFVSKFNDVLGYGVNNIEKVLSDYKISNNIINISEMQLKNYLTKNISYDFDNDKKKGLELFFKYLKS